MPNYKLIGKNYTTPDLIAKVTGRAKYAEDFRAEGMLFSKLLLSPMPHARVRGMDTTAALAMPGVEAILTADDLPEVQPPIEAGLTNEPLYEGEPILAVAAIDELTAAEAIERIVLVQTGQTHDSRATRSTVESSKPSNGPSRILPRSRQGDCRREKRPTNGRSGTSRLASRHLI